MAYNGKKGQLSVNQHAWSRAKALTPGAAGHIVKLFDPDPLLAVIGGHLSVGL